MAKKPFTPSPELIALLAADRVDLAARLFVAAFPPTLDEPYPRVTGAGLGEEIGKLASIPLSSWSWTTHRNPDATLARVILELILLWERAGIACRGLAQEHSEIALLFAGEELLRGPDPLGATKRALAGR